MRIKIEGDEEAAFDLKWFLERYGYLGYARARADGGATEEEQQLIELAIKTFQENERFEATGKLDEKTKAKMMEPRCAVINEYESTENDYDSYWALALAFKTIFYMSHRLNLAATITEGACKIYKRLEDDKRAWGRYMEAFVSACIIIASGHQGKTVTDQEIRSVVFETSLIEIDQAKEYIVEHYLKEATTNIHAGDGDDDDHHLYLTHLCRNIVGMSKQELKAVQQSVQKARDLDINSSGNRSTSPISVALAIIYMVAQLSEKSNKPLPDISFESRVSEDSINNAYRDYVYPHAATILPEWYAKERDLNNLIAPTPLQDA